MTETTQNANPDAQQKTTAYVVGEWLIVILSVIMLLFVAGYLLYTTTLHRSKYVAVQMQPKLNQVQRVDGEYVVNVKVINNGRRSLSKWAGRIHYMQNGGRQTIRLKTTYLVPGTPQNFYVHLPGPPKKLHLKMETVSAML